MQSPITIRTVTAAASADWAPYIRQAALVVAAAAALAFTLGYTAGRWVHTANDHLSATAVLLATHQDEPADQGQHGPGCPDEQLLQIEAPAPEGAVVITTRQMARDLVAQGASRREAARLLGISDRTVRRYLRETVA